MTDEGWIDLDVYWDGTTIQRAAVRSHRPLSASRLLQGKTQRQVEICVPLLFSVCASAQTVAAAGAMEAACGIHPPAAVALQRELRVAAECLQEYAWRILLDLPGLFREAPQTERFVTLRSAVQAASGSAGAADAWWRARIGDTDMQRWRHASEFLLAQLAEDVYAMPTAAWLELGSVSQIESWIGAGGSVPARLLGRVWPSALGRSSVARLPRLGAAQAACALAQRIAGDADFSAMPQWADAPAETGALARTADHPLIKLVLDERGNTIGVRLLARLVELALVGQRLNRLSSGGIGLSWIDASAVAPGVGLSTTETARGMLMHYVEMDANRVAKYRIVAPTEWNFHPRGAFVQGLSGGEASGEPAVQHVASLMAHALDPCVGYRVRAIRA